MKAVFHSLMRSLGLSGRPQREAKGYIVFTQNVADLPEDQVGTFCETFINRAKQHVPEGWCVVTQPVRFPERSLVSIHPVSADFDEVRSVWLGMPPANFEWPDDVKDTVIDYVLHMMGEPRELDQRSLDFCYRDSFQEMERHARSKYGGSLSAVPLVGVDVLKRGVLARAKVLLGRHHCKNEASAAACHTTTEAGEKLVEEGLRDLKHWVEEVACL